MAASEKKVADTRSLCPECGEVIDARLVERGGSIVMLKQCPEHGDFELVLFDDAGFYRRCLRHTAKAPESLERCDVTACLECGRHVDYVKTIMIDATERCNLNCPACFTNTHARESREPSIDEICSRLFEWKTRPTVLICGGEPTLRDDLPELIEAVRSLGFVIKVASNGIRLQDEAYVRRLGEAGLDWVLFQFDGFSDDIYMKTRGRALVDVKEKALRNLAATGIKVCLAYMVVRGVNDGDLGRVVDYVMGSDNVMHIGFTVMADVGRCGFGAENTTGAKYVLEAIERGTRGRVTLEDFMSTRRIGHALFRLTGNLEFQQKTCFHMALLHRTSGGYVPVNRYFSPAGLIGNLRGAAELAALYGSLRKWDRLSMTGKVKLFTVEDFRASATIDLIDANRCNKVYMGDRGYIPPCIYNTKYRPQCWLPADGGVD